MAGGKAGRPTKAESEAKKKAAAEKAEALEKAREKEKSQRRKTRVRDYPTPEALEAKIDEYFDHCIEAGDIFPDDAGMLEYLGLRPRSIEAYIYEDEQKDGYREVLDRAKMRRESWLARRMVSEPRLATGCLAALKQPKNGGYIDRPQVQVEAKTLIIKTEGVGEDAFG